MGDTAEHILASVKVTEVIVEWVGQPPLQVTQSYSLTEKHSERILYNRFTNSKHPKHPIRKIQKQTPQPTQYQQLDGSLYVMQRLCTQCAAGVGITKTSYELLSEASFPSSSLSFTLPFTPLLPAGSPECITSSKPQFMKTHSLQLAFSLEPHEDFGSYCIKNSSFLFRPHDLGCEPSCLNYKL